MCAFFLGTKNKKGTVKEHASVKKSKYAYQCQQIRFIYYGLLGPHCALPLFISN